MRYYIVACDLANGATKYLDYIVGGVNVVCVDSPRRAAVSDNESDARADARAVLAGGYCESASGSRIVNARVLYYDE